MNRIVFGSLGCLHFSNHIYFSIKTVYGSGPYKVAPSLKIADPHGTATCKCCDVGPPPLRVIVYCLVGNCRKTASKLRGSPTNLMHRVIESYLAIYYLPSCMHRG